MKKKLTFPISVAVFKKTVGVYVRQVLSAVWIKDKQILCLNYKRRGKVKTNVTSKVEKHILNAPVGIGKL